jgi:hypothetical protein
MWTANSLDRTYDRSRRDLARVAERWDMRQFEAIAKRLLEFRPEPSVNDTRNINGRAGSR